MSAKGGFGAAIELSWQCDDACFKRKKIIAEKRMFLKYENPAALGDLENFSPKLERWEPLP